MANKNTRKILLSLVVGVVVSCVALNTFSKMQQQIKEKDQLIKVMELNQKTVSEGQYTYLTAVRDMQPGDTITESDIKSVAFGEEQPDGLSSADMVVGNVLLEPVKNGQVLTGFVFTGVVSPSKANSQGLREGYRALTLSTSALDGLSPQMKSGAIVDVFSKSKNSQFVLSKVKILSLENTENTDKTDKNLTITNAKTATFEVPVDKIQQLVEIYSSGKILLVMRPAGDDTVIVGKKQVSENYGGNSGFHNAGYNYGYNSPLPAMSSLPSLPTVQTYEDSSINEMPAPVVPKKKPKTVEIIEASNKTHVNFD